MGTRSRLLLARITTCLAAAVIAITATAQTSQPSADPGSPKAAIMDYSKALNAGDGTAMHALLLTTNPTEERMANAMVDYAVALTDLSKKMVAKYGAESAHAAIGDPDVMAKTAEETIGRSTEAVKGDTATVSVNKSAQGQMTLKKVDGKWKICVAEMARDQDPANVAKTLDAIDKGNAIIKQMATEVDAGKYPTAEAAKTALNEKIGRMQAAAATMPTTGMATTKPA
jgi:hypothetical protein